jgi:hypothetical protein
MPRSSHSSRRTSTWLVGSLLFATFSVACARSNFDPDETGSAGAAGTGVTGGAAGKSGAGTSGTGGTTAGSSGATAGTGGSGGKGGSSAGTGGKGGTAGTTAGTGGTTAGTGGSGGKGGSQSTGGCRLVINEIGAAGETDPNDEFLELYNAGDADCAVDGWTVKYRSDKNSADIDVWAGTSGETIAPGGFYVIGGPKFTGTADFSYDQGKLSNDGGGVGLKDDGGTVVDKVAWGSAKDSHEYADGTPAAAVSDGSSNARSPDGQDSDDNATDFTEGSRTPGAANLPFRSALAASVDWLAPSPAGGSSLARIFAGAALRWRGQLGGSSLAWAIFTAVHTAGCSNAAPAAPGLFSPIGDLHDPGGTRLARAIFTAAHTAGRSNAAPAAPGFFVRHGPPEAPVLRAVVGRTRLPRGASGDLRQPAASSAKTVASGGPRYGGSWSAWLTSDSWGNGWTPPARRVRRFPRGGRLHPTQSQP